jgi:hypothetical protein
MKNDASESHVAQKYRYRIFLALESILLLITMLVFMGAYELQRQAPRWAIGLLGLLGMWHIVAIPICIMYLVGRPIVMSLEPLFPSRETRAFRRELRERPALSDGEFYARFYPGSVIPAIVPVRIRRYLMDIDPLVEQITPPESLFPLLDDVDFADILHGLGREFSVRFTKADYPLVDGTFDNLVRLVVERLVPKV